MVNDGWGGHGEHRLMQLTHETPVFPGSSGSALLRGRLPTFCGRKRCSVFSQLEFLQEECNGFP